MAPSPLLLPLVLLLVVVAPPLASSTPLTDAVDHIVNSHTGLDEELDALGAAAEKDEEADGSSPRFVAKRL